LLTTMAHVQNVVKNYGTQTIDLVSANPAFKRDALKRAP
jgi:hypothetical protein